jgi:putative hydrolase of the HAD superfamily
MSRSPELASSIKFVYFDLGNVLLNFSHQQACVQIAQITDLPVEDVWRTIFETPMVVQYELGQVTDDQFHQAFCAATGTAVKLQPFLRAFSDIFCLNQPVMEIAVELSRRNFPIGILSNTCTAHWNFSRERFPELSDCFATNVLSFEEACAKPDGSIYEAAIKRAKAKPENIFFVDDRADNVAGACAAGLDAVIFESALRLRQALHQRGLLLP